MSTQEAAVPVANDANPAKGGFLKPVQISEKTSDGVQLEKAIWALVVNGDLKQLTEALGEIKKSHGAEFSAIVSIVPVYETMPRQKVMRKRNLKRPVLNSDGTPKKDAQGKVIEEVYDTEDFESLQKYADSKRVNLTNRFGMAFENDPVRPIFGGIVLYDKPADEGASVTAETEEENDEEE